MTSPPAHDAIVVVSFGGPEAPDEVMPFLLNVVEGRVPEARLREVAAHYELFSGVSPINAQNRALLAALRAELERLGPRLPVYWGNRHARPFIKETLAEMAEAGVRRALAFVTSAFSSYSGCRQYQDAVTRARAELGPKAPEVEKLRGFHNHPAFVLALADRVRTALAGVPAERRGVTPVVFTAHSLPNSMAAACDYEAEFRDLCGLIAERVSPCSWSFAYQSGPAGAPWLGPDIADHLRQIRAAGARDVVVAPIGFFSDHMEVVYDLDVAAKAVADEIGLGMVRARTAGTHPLVIGMIRELILERTAGAPLRWLGSRGPRVAPCVAGCCPAPSGGRPGR